MVWDLRVLRRYAVFSGRARCREYWMFMLVNLIIYLVLMLIEALAGNALENVLTTFYLLAVYLPMMAVTARRMHDTDHRGWWLLVPIMSLVFAVSEGTRGDNRFGPDPKANTR